MTTREHAPLTVLAVKRAVADVMRKAPAGGWIVAVLCGLCICMCLVLATQHNKIQLKSTHI